MRPSEASGAWWTWRELNPRPPARQAGALPLSYRPGLRFATLTQAAPSDVEGRRYPLTPRLVWVTAQPTAVARSVSGWRRPDEFGWGPGTGPHWTPRLPSPARHPGAGGC